MEIEKYKKGFKPKQEISDSEIRARKYMFLLNKNETKGHFLKKVEIDNSGQLRCKKNICPGKSSFQSATFMFHGNINSTTAKVTVIMTTDNWRSTLVRWRILPLASKS